MNWGRKQYFCLKQNDQMKVKSEKQRRRIKMEKPLQVRLSMR